TINPEPSEEKKVYTFEGVIHKYPIVLQLEQIGSSEFEGYYYYKKEEKPINLVGSLQDRILKLRTFNQENGHVEHFEGKWLNNGQLIKGRWKASDIGNHFNFSLKRQE